MPTATEISWISCEASTCDESTSQEFNILPRSGKIAWKSLLRACLAEPPAESPSTKNNSAWLKSCCRQSANLPGRAGPWWTRFRATCLAWRKRFCARSIARLAMISPWLRCWLSQSANASFTTLLTNAAVCLELNRSLVWPANCGSFILTDNTYWQGSHRSSAVNLTPRGVKLRCSQKVDNASKRPERRPLTCVPPCTVGIKFT